MIRKKGTQSAYIGQCEVKPKQTRIRNSQRKSKVFPENLLSKRKTLKTARNMRVFAQI